MPVDDSFTMLDLKLDFFYSLFSVLLLLDIIREFVVSENCISLFLVIFFEPVRYILDNLTKLATFASMESSGKKESSCFSISSLFKCHLILAAFRLMLVFDIHFLYMY